MPKRLVIVARFEGRCAVCGTPIRQGQRMVWGKGQPVSHVTGECPPKHRPGLLRLKDE